MDLRHQKYTEQPLVKTKIIATVGPACAQREQLKSLALAGADIFRLNFAHGNHEWLANVVQTIREVSHELKRPIGILGDLSGPKIRLGVLPEGGICCVLGGEFDFVKTADPNDPTKLTSTYKQLIDDLQIDDRVLLADGVVGMRVIAKDPDAKWVRCVVEQPGCIRSRQGINLPGVNLSTPCLTEKDYADLKWGTEQELDYLGLSFVRRAEDVLQLREAISECNPEFPPAIVAKIEKYEAIDDLERILQSTDAVMVARGDLGVEVDLPRVPLLQKQIIKSCKEHRIPVITATQMLESMHTSELPTRAETSDVANAVLDGSDAVMLSGETAIGSYPVAAVSMMSRICLEAEKLVKPFDAVETPTDQHQYAKIITEAVTLGAGAAAENLNADLIVVATHSGRTALALSKQRKQVPILALSDMASTARRMCLFWGVTPLETQAVHLPADRMLHHIVEWGKKYEILKSGSRLVLVGQTDWSEAGHDQMLVHVVP